MVMGQKSSKIAKNAQKQCCCVVLENEVFSLRKGARRGGEEEEEERGGEESERVCEWPTRVRCGVAAGDV